MLVNLTPNLVEIERRVQVAKELDFEYTPQNDPMWSHGVGLYQCNMGFSFTYEEFLEKIDGWAYNDDLFRSYSELNGKWVPKYGVADNIEQIKKFYNKEINDPNEKWVISFSPVYQDLENKHKGGGWRWHKWGEYIGELNPQCEYFDDEDFGGDVKCVICFHLYKVLEN